MRGESFKQQSFRQRAETAETKKNGVNGGESDVGDSKQPAVENLGKRKSEYGNVSDIERLIIGERIPASQRTTFTPREYLSEWETGSIGFLDFTHKGDTISIGEMGVEPEYRGRGFGERLLEEVEALAAHRGAKRIQFIAVESANLPMVSLLKNHGYKPTRGHEPEIFVKDVEEK